MILDDILDSKRAEVEAAKRGMPLEDLAHRLRGHLAEQSLRKALASSGKSPALIAELKRESPSRGMLRERFDPVSLAQQMQDAGASALSVLTDEPFFGGKLEFLRDVRQFTDLPLLRKDFIVDPYQVYQAAAYGADAVLLITQILSTDELRDCLQAADTLGLDALVEVHAEAELAKALSAGATLIGVNHRDLDALTMDLSLSERARELAGADAVLVAESGLRTIEDLRRMRDRGLDAVLVGEALMRAPDPGRALEELLCW